MQCPFLFISGAQPLPSPAPSDLETSNTEIADAGSAEAGNVAAETSNAEAANAEAIGTTTTETGSAQTSDNDSAKEQKEVVAANHANTAEVAPHSDSAAVEKEAVTTTSSPIQVESEHQGTAAMAQEQTGQADGKQSAALDGQSAIEAVEPGPIYLGGEEYETQEQQLESEDLALKALRANSRFGQLNSYLCLFGPALEINLDLDQVETLLLWPRKSDVLISTHMKLLQLLGERVSEEKWEVAVGNHWHWALAEGEYWELALEARLQLLLILCELQFDFGERMQNYLREQKAQQGNNYSVSIREEVVGVDSAGSQFFYFEDNDGAFRLCRLAKRWEELQDDSAPRSSASEAIKANANAESEPVAAIKQENHEQEKKQVVPEASHAEGPASETDGNTATVAESDRSLAMPEAPVDEGIWHTMCHTVRFSRNTVDLF